MFLGSSDCCAATFRRVEKTFKRLDFSALAGMYFSGSVFSVRPAVIPRRSSDQKNRRNFFPSFQGFFLLQSVSPSVESKK
ncbi:hypothetical protein BOX24_04350 [Leptospirillum ferriphilum]|uniref:Uncharacterized protein n=2 Tax=Leptospirillum ferriphilum TaxID=178606 RepID=A0A059XWP9_9BACT|nr:hypothetical protein Y981_03410 [Leptospirillum ferriphilum YSK]OOH73298.1 hypothetical protein BOX24_04350 [Leptospirillum ferriphilum]